MPKILIVEDDSAVRAILKHILVAERMNIVAVEDAEEALKRLRSEEKQPFDLVVLDLMLPGMDGISLCQEIRKGSAGSANRDLPILMLTARDDEMSMVESLEVGADDYITKPFRRRELVSRLRAHLRRRRMNAKNSGSDKQWKFEFPGLELDLFKRQVLLKGKPVELTPTEFKVLALLASQPGRVYSREQIMRHLRGSEFSGVARTADVHTQHLRKKLEDDPTNPRYLQTVRGFGYKFAEFSSRRDSPPAGTASSL